MTKQDLDRHLELRQQLENDREMLAALEAAAGLRTQRLDGMPHTLGIGDPVSYLAVEIVDMRETITRREAAVARSEMAVKAYIQTIEDSLTRMIFRLRFIRGMVWKEVAATIGGGNTEAGVKMACYRYIARGGPARMGRPPKQKGKPGHEKADF